MFTDPGARSPVPSGSRILEFDVLRAAAILLLILHHGGIYNFSIGGFSLLPVRNMIALLLLGTFLFLSGYFIVQSFEKRGMRSFWVDKLTRLVIPYWIALLCFIFIMDIAVYPRDVLVHFAGSQMVLSPRFLTPIITLWYVGLTLVYYLIFCLLLQWIRRPEFIAAAALLIYGLAAFLRMEFGLFDHRFFYYYFYYFVFTAGIILYKTGGLKWVTTTRFLLLDKLFLFALSVLFLFPVRNQVREDVSIRLVIAITFFILSAILLFLNLLKLIPKKPVVIQFFSFVSTASYFAYLFHRPVWRLIVGTGADLPRHTYSIYLLLTGFFIVIPASYFMQIGYNRLIDRITEKVRKTAVPSSPNQAV